MGAFLPANDVSVVACASQSTSPRMRCGRGYQQVTLAAGAAATTAFSLTCADFAAVVHTGAGAQAAAASWAVADLSAFVMAPQGPGAPAAGPAAAPAQAAHALQARSPVSRAKSTG